MKALRLTEQQLQAIQKRMLPKRGKMQKVSFNMGVHETKRRDMKPKVDYARELAQQIRDAGLPEPVLEWPFDRQLEGAGRGWRFDLCWRDRLLALECDGAVHRVKKRFKADLTKQQCAFALGYKLLRVSPEQVRNGEALELVRKALL